MRMYSELGPLEDIKRGRLMSDRKIKKGDTIQCYDADDMVETMTDLLKYGIDTDFRYELNGEKGFWLIVTKGEK